MKIRNDSDLAQNKDKKTPTSKVVFLGCIIALVVYIFFESTWIFYSYKRGPLQWQHWYKPNGFVRFILEPNLRVSAKMSRYETKVKTNSLGFRSPDFSVKKPEDTIRIICLGGSTTFGTGVSDNEHTFPYALERILDKDFNNVNVEVINAGVAGYTTTHSLTHLVTRLVYFEPDIVVVYHAINDLGFEYQQEDTPFDIWGRPWQKDKWTWFKTYSILGICVRQVKSFFRTRDVSLAVPNEAKRVIVNGLKINQKEFDCFKNNLISIIRICNQHRIRPVIITFPYSGHMLKGDFYDEIICRNLKGRELAAALDEYNHFILFLEKDEDVSIIPNGIPENRNLWSDYHHLNDQGCQVLAENISVELKELVGNLLQDRANDVGTDL